jgi:hypothetical protein
MNVCYDKDICGIDYESLDEKQIEADILKRKMVEKGLLILDLCEEERFAAALCIALVNTYKDTCCKSKDCKLDTPLLNGAFRVLISTPQGPFIHQFDAEYWDFFKCPEVLFIDMADYLTDVLDYNKLIYMDRDVLFKSVLVKDTGLAIIKTN